MMAPQSCGTLGVDSMVTILVVIVKWSLGVGLVAGGGGVDNSGDKIVYCLGSK